VLTRTGFVSTARPSVSTTRPVSTARPSVSTAWPVSTARPSINTARPVSTASLNISIVRPGYASRPIYPRMDNVRPRGSCSPIKRSYYTKPTFRPKDLKQDVKTFGDNNMTTAEKRAVVNTIGIKSLVMSSASSAVTYTSVYTDSEPGRVFWGADEEISDGEVPRVIVYGYDGLPMQPVAPPSPDYVPGPEHPASPDYVPGPEHSPASIEIPFVPEPEYPEYLVPSEDEAPMEDQPLPADASPVALSPGYVPDSDPEEDPEEDSEEEHADYPADGGDGDDEPSDDDSDDDDADDDEEPFEDEEDDEEEEEHLAPADSPVIPVADPVPSAGDTEAFETDESAPTPRPPQIRIPFAQTRLRRARKTVRPEPPMSASMEARIAEHAAAPTPPLPVASSPLPLPSPLTTSPTDTGAPLGYRAAGIRMRAADASPPLSLPPTSPRTDVPRLGEISEAWCQQEARSYTPCAVDTWDEIVRERIRHRRTALAIDREAVYARIAWTSSEERSAAIEAHVRTLEAPVATKCYQQEEPRDKPPPPQPTPTTTVTEAQLPSFIDQGVCCCFWQNVMQQK
ncbi:hypothetical protein Tco_0714296, partial [Tanacetum coccineum]